MQVFGLAMDEVYIHYKPKLCITGPECVSGKHQIRVARTNEQSGKKEARVLFYCLSMSSISHLYESYWGTSVNSRTIADCL
jgi:hypothetical protein